MRACVCEGVGKSQLFWRYTRRDQIPSYIPTIGVDFANKKISVPGHADEHNMQLWVHQSTHPAAAAARNTALDL
jgi:GTPase SAR1 family protein